MNPSCDRIGVLLIGQTPRADLTAPLENLNGSCEFVVRGALDGVQRADVPVGSADAYPLVTLLRDGTRVTVDEHFLTPFLQKAIDELEQEGVSATLLLCAGPFRNLVSSRPLVRPFQLATSVLQSLGLRRVCIVVPTDDQRRPAKMKWAEAGLEPVIISAEEKPTERSLEDWLVEQARALPGLAALVLDYVGYPAELLHHLQTEVQHPVVDLGHLALTVTETLFLFQSSVLTPSSGGSSV